MSKTVRNPSAKLLKQALDCFHNQAYDQAAEICSKLLACDPLNARGYGLAGVVASQQGDPLRAAALVERAIEIKPENASFYNNLGLIWLKNNQPEKAKKYFRLAIDLVPDKSEYWLNLSNTEKALGKEEKALSALDCAAWIAPENPEIWFQKGQVLTDLGLLGAAAGCYRNVLAINSGHAEAHINLGNLYRKKYDYTKALDHYSRAFKLKPNLSGIYNNMGLCLFDMGYRQQALEMYSCAIDLEPGYTEAMVNKALALLMMEQFEAGWELYERRRLNCSTIPEWKGERFDGKSLLVQAEQGLGDTLQFVRYLPMVKKKGHRVVLAVQEPLVRLLSDIPGADEIILLSKPGDPQERDFDLTVPLLSLPKIFKMNLSNIPRQQPFFLAPADELRKWRPKLDLRELKIGLVWAGNPRNNYDHLRSCTLEALAPLFEIPKTQFFALQKGAGREALKTSRWRDQIVDLGPDLIDFVDTAVALSMLDITICVDTAVVHLAGMLNCPVYLLASFSPDWRWCSERKGSPWYPSMQIFRQSQPGVWHEPVSEIRRALQGLVDP